MRLIIVVVGIVVLLMGTVWAFQGAGYLLGSFLYRAPQSVTYQWILNGTDIAAVPQTLCNDV